MVAIGRMNADPGERRVRERGRQGAIPGQAGETSPATAQTVNQRAGVKILSRAQIADTGQPGRVFHVRCSGRAFRFGAEQPRGGDETARRQPRRDEFSARLGDAAKRFVVIEVVEFAFIVGVEPGKKLVAQLFPRARRPLVKVTVDHDLVSMRLQFLQPSHKPAVLGRAPTVMIVGHHQEGANQNPMMAKLLQDFRDSRLSNRRDIMHGHDQCFTVRFR